MSDVVNLVSRLLSDHCSAEVVLRAEGGEWPDTLWGAVEAAGLPLALVAEGEHSLGVVAEEVFRAVRLAGQFAAPIPLPETLLANWLLAQCGLAPQSGPLVLACDASLRLDGATLRLTGEVASVPWGRRAGIVVGFEHQQNLRVAFLGRAGFTLHEGANVAREPRDRLVLDADLTRVLVAPAPAALDRLRLRAAGAALRCSQIAGAIHGITAITVEYANQRQQFGRPISKFQAVQQHLAVLATQAAAASSAADLAAQAFAEGIRVPAIAAAKTFAGEAAGAAAAIAHQMHGAMGFSQEYPLHLRTRRLWSWRDECGNETEWATQLGAGLALRGADALWAEVVAIA